MMDGFSIIQNFFTRMQCNFCSSYLEPEGIQLIRQEQDVYVVNIQCVHCTRQMGIALVGLEGAEVSEETAPKYVDPELTKEEVERLAVFQPVNYDDVLEAHHFFSNLDADWHKYLPAEMPEPEITSEWESEAS